MKKFYLIILALLAAITSCSIKEEVVPESQAPKFRGIMETPEYLSETRAYADQGYHVYWTEGDRVSIFTEKTYNRQYEFVGRTGTTAGDFEYVPSSGLITEVPIESGYNYAIYPYYRYNACDYDGTLTVTFPQERTYNDQTSKSIGANIALVARAETNEFMFKHAAGYVGLKFYGDDVTIASITFKSNNGEPLSGYPYVVFSDDDIPYVTFSEDSDGVDKTTIVCDPPIKIGTSAADCNTFWFTLPPAVLTKGFTFTVTDINGGTYSKSRNSSYIVERKVFKTMAALQVIPEGGSVTPTDVPVTGVQLAPSSASLEVGGTVTLTATVLPSDATNKSVAWTSSNRSVATVDGNGKVTAVAAGEAVITVVTSDGGFTASSTITVTSSTPEPVAVESVSLDQTDLTLNVGGTATLTATVLPENADNKSVTWTSSNSSIATVDASGKVTAVAPGLAVIIVTTVDGGKIATCAVTVTNPAVPVQSVSLDKTTLDLNVGENATLVATVLPENADDKSVTWSSSNTAVATVDATGKVTAVAAGEAVITVTTTDGGKTATCTVTVTNPAVPVQSVTLDKTTLSLMVGKNATLVATVLPENADDKTVTWSSSNTAVATVDATGKVTAVAAGEAVITVTTNDGGKTATCTVTVTDDDDPNHAGDPIVIEEEGDF